MAKKKEAHVELRYYEIPQNEHVLALLGESWNRIYHNPVDDLHFHNLLEIGFCHDGAGNMIFDGGTFIPYVNGTFTVIPQNLPHSTFSSGEGTNFWEFLFLDVETFLRDAYSTDPIFAHELIARIKKRSFVLHEDQNAMLADSIKALLSKKSEQGEFSEEIEKCLVLRLLLEIARLNPLEGKKNEQPQKRRKAILDSLDYVNEHFAEPIKIQTLAESCHMSETHFRRLFLDTMHMLPVDYINFVRVQKACEHLNSSNDSIENVALRVGFISQSTFNRNFRRFLGVSPLKWKTAADNYKMKLLQYKITALRGW